MYRCKGMSKNSEKDARSAYFKLQFSRVLIGLIDVLHVFLCPNMLLDQVIFITVQAQSTTEEHLGMFVYILKGRIHKFTERRQKVRICNYVLKSTLCALLQKNTKASAGISLLIP